MDSCRPCGCAVPPRTEMPLLGLRRPGNSGSSSGTKSVSTSGMRKKSSSASPPARPGAAWSAPRGTRPTRAAPGVRSQTRHRRRGGQRRSRDAGCGGRAARRTHPARGATALSADRGTRARRRAPEARSRQGRDMRRSAPAPHEPVVAELWLLHAGSPVRHPRSPRAASCQDDEPLPTSSPSEPEALPSRCDARGTESRREGSP
jgi:hypothetical protein